MILRPSRCFAVFFVLSFLSPERSSIAAFRLNSAIPTFRPLLRVSLGMFLCLTTAFAFAATRRAAPAPTAQAAPAAPVTPIADSLVRNAFRPSHTMIRGLLQLQVNRDGSSTEISETLVRIETEAGVKSYSEQSHEYNGALSDLEVLEAATIQPDGSRIDVPPDRILTRDQLGEEAAVLNTDGKVKVIVFPAVAVGSQLLLRLKTTQHTPEFPGHFISASYFNPHSRYESYTVELAHDPQ
ncbi:MAG: DUF3857 domain-containing protein, partial [Betaproteobacteria bacterium]|nr:DUF3857 domain-containing protein [Betaproteobacteria bacterium]